MDFKRFKNCMVANIPLQQYCVNHSSPVVTLVFMKDMTELPAIGFSKRSADEIIVSDMDPDNGIVFREWSEYAETYAWANEPVKKDDFLCILVQFGKGQLGVRYRKNMNSATTAYFFAVPQNAPIYLAISSSAIYEKGETNMCHIAMLDTANMLKWIHIKARAKKSVTTSKNIVTAANVPTTSSSADNKPFCAWCCERAIDTLLLPCGHAVCCSECRKNYIINERNKRHPGLSQASADVLCPICRKKMEAIARIWFHSEKCRLCGCGQLSAVAGGQNGCGCVLGCYDKAVQLLQHPNAKCPYCQSPIVEILRMYLQGDYDGSNDVGAAAAAFESLNLKS